VDRGQIAALEAEWQGRVQVTPGYCGWEPYDPGKFTRLLSLCLPHVPPGNRTFLDVGCGIGTKCLLAAQAGLDPSGFDRVPEFVAEARRLGVAAEVADARDYQGYGAPGLVYVNHPLACGGGCDDEAALEHLIHERMASGAVLMAVNYDLAPGCTVHPPSRPCDEGCPPGAAGWPQVARLGAWDAAWVKPLWRSRWCRRVR
jgi:SAM-dependent methyltransferase